jgi:hypothetical protein
MIDYGEIGAKMRSRKEHYRLLTAYVTSKEQIVLACLP